MSVILGKTWRAYLFLLIFFYFHFVGCRFRCGASGEISTLAHWMRDFVQRHPKYAKDSHVPDETTYDMIKTMNDITLGTKECPELLGDFKSKTERKVTTAVCRAEAAIVAAHEKSVVS